MTSSKIVTGCFKASPFSMTILTSSRVANSHEGSSYRTHHNVTPHIVAGAAFIQNNRSRHKAVMTAKDMHCMTARKTS